MCAYKLGKRFLENSLNKTLQKINPLNINVLRGFLVDKVIEISNLEILKDLAEVVDSLNMKFGKT